MSLGPVPDVPQIERELDALLERSSDAWLLGMRAPAPRGWPEEIVRRGRAFRLAWCTSELEIRERLDAAEQTGERLVVLTPIDAASLSTDILARFPRARLEQADRWAALRSAFRARDVDPRLRGHGWLADLLLASPPTGGYPPVAAGLLDLETVWSTFQERVLGLPEGRVDAAALLAWSLEPAGAQRLASLGEPARSMTVDRLSVQGGPGAGHILNAAMAGRAEDALPAALACGVLFGLEPAPSALRDAAIRLEPVFGGKPIDDRAGAVLAEAARRVMTRLTASQASSARAVQTRAAAMLAEIRAEAWASHSPALEIGFDARMLEAAQAIGRAAETKRADQLRTAWAEVERALQHDRAEDAKLRTTRLRLAVRLAGWLATPATFPSGIAAAAAAYAASESFADCARVALGAGDPLPEVARVYESLRDKARERREDWNRAFATCVADWNGSGAPGNAPLPVEKVLDRIVAPLAREAPVLLLVLDGLSFAVWHVLVEDILRLGWAPLAPEGSTRLPPGVAAFPTVTQVSRASLLCGTLARGQQSVEQAGFSRHGALLAASRTGKPPKLFHKADLGRGAELEELVRASLADPSQRVVGVVHNVVDAQLAGSDQLDLSWSADQMRQLTAILRVARDAGRVVVVTSDHGHVIDDRTTASVGDGASRWRAAGTPAPGEILLAGGRVLSPTGDHSILAAWSETVRFSARHAGYHGGASPQEALVPITVLKAGGAPPSGWGATVLTEPGWWRGVEEPPSNVAAQEWEPQRARTAAPPPRADLFAGVGEGERAPATKPAQAVVPWIADLLASDSFKAQRRIAGRAAPPDDQIALLLSTLASRSGRVPVAALAQSMHMPALRIGGLVTAAGRVLNLDQARILWVDGADVVLDESLLRLQFELGDRT